MKVTTAKKWFGWHKWTSLICTLFLLIWCLTGLPLIFHHEIDEWLEPEQHSSITSGTPQSLDALLQKAQKDNPDRIPRYVFWDEEAPEKLMFDFAPSMDAEYTKSKYVAFNIYTGESMPSVNPNSIMTKILRIHADLFLGIGGKLFLGLIGLVFIIAIISGVVLYGRIMKKFDFGMVRKYRSKRLRWLDTHNLIGIITLCWASVVGFTGIINCLSDVMLALWQQGQLKEMTAPYAHQKPVEGKLASLDSAVAVAQRAAPDMETRIIAYPGSIFSSKHHYAVFMKGKTPLTSRLLKPALIDAKTGKLTDIREMPWYVNTLFISEPLHFGDYGGMPLKVIWGLFDIATIVVLVTGLYLWINRRKAARQQWTLIEERERITEEDETI
ncbi:peptidase [Niabella ginsenosidivorans]|uniref:Peptidase n=1 Tax=Niabella ginsenosidivorans TaxID=1176587 RepID=A0A1A9I6C0_9BACT|nr:PepSY-associated TM helix domain-containing protein [Niabella ginsenosidivorans]ANH83237.1 peptidase [Niabella ginsenosidivorans]